MPATFTSIKDDTVGGDSNDDGTSTTAGDSDYNAAISPRTGSTLNLVGATFVHGSYSLFAMCISGSPQYDISITAADNVFGSGMYLVGCGVNNMDLKRNVFQGSHVPALAISQLEMSKVILSGVDKNTFTGSDRGRVLDLNNASVASTNAWSLSSAGNAILLANTVTVDGSLTIDPGTIVKLKNGGKIQVNSGGLLDVQGTHSSKATITSHRDDSTGGDSNGDGVSTGSVGNYFTGLNWGEGAGITTSYLDIKFAFFGIQATGSNASLSHIKVMDSSSGIMASGDSKINASDATFLGLSDGIIASQSSQVTYRGSFSNISDRAVESCSWDKSCFVDTAYVDWGDAAGPVGGNLACGATTTNPWLYNGVSSNSGMAPNCNGGLTPTQQVSNSSSYFSTRMSDRQISCDNGFDDACTAISNALACLSGAMNVAQSTAPWPLPPTNTAEQVNAAGGLLISGANDYLSAQATTTVSGFTFSLITQAIGVAGTLVTMADAYSSCAP